MRLPHQQFLAFLLVGLANFAEGRPYRAAPPASYLKRSAHSMSGRHTRRSKATTTPTSVTSPAMSEPVLPSAAAVIRYDKHRLALRRTDHLEERSVTAARRRRKTKGRPADDLRQEVIAFEMDQITLRNKVSLRAKRFLYHSM